MPAAVWDRGAAEQKKQLLKTYKFHGAKSSDALKAWMLAQAPLLDIKPVGAIREKKKADLTESVHFRVNCNPNMEQKV